MMTVTTTMRPRRARIPDSMARSGASAFAGHQSQHHQEDHGANQRDDEAEDVAAAGDVEEAGHQPPTDHAPDDADDHIKDDAVSMTTDETSGDGTRNAAHDNRPKPADPFHLSSQTEDRRHSVVPVSSKAVNRGIRFWSACEPIEPIMGGSLLHGHAGKEVPYQDAGDP